MIDLFRPFMSEEARQKVQQVLTPSPEGRLYIGQGKLVDEFEAQLEKEFEEKNILTLNAATSGLDLALHMIGVVGGDEVITTPITCTATNSPIVNRFATPVWADVDPMTGLINPHDVEKKITKRTKAIIGVNWGGKMPDYEHLKSFGIPVIEDAAHGPYATLQTRGDYIVWSFQAIKFLTTGDGGAIVTPDVERARLLRWYGLDRRSSKDFRCEQNITEVGYKYHMNDIAAAMGLGNLPYLYDLIRVHRANAALYDKVINDSKYVMKAPHDSLSPYWIYTLIVDNPKAFTQYMNDAGIMVSPVHARNDKHDAFHYPNGPLAGVDFFDSHQISIPVGWWLSSRDAEFIANMVNRYNG